MYSADADGRGRTRTDADGRGHLTKQKQNLNTFFLGVFFCWHTLIMIPRIMIL